MDNRNIDPSTLLGIAAALALMFAAIYTSGSIKAFIDLPSVMIVLGGTLAVTIACFSIPEVVRAQGLVLKTIFYPSRDPGDVGRDLLGFAEEARKNGVLSLQLQVEQDDSDEFLKKGLGMIIDGVEPDAVEKILRQEIHSMVERHTKGASVLRKSAEVSPAMGLIGTLIGLVQMLGNLDDPSAIGPAMAIALLTTLYGAILAYVVFSPLASKLERNSREEALIYSLYMKGLVSIGKNENPRRVEMLLNTILPPANRLKVFD